jgi:hypothetical protein
LRCSSSIRRLTAWLNGTSLARIQCAGQQHMGARTRPRKESNMTKVSTSSWGLRKASWGGGDIGWGIGGVALVSTRM